MSDKKLLVVFGATGNQGSSVVHAVFSSPELSSQYHVRAITRDTSSSKAQALSSAGAEVVAADLDDPSSLTPALQGAHTVFAVTVTTYDGKTREVETRQATAVVAEAIRQGAQYFIWSSMSHPYKISNGKLTRAEHFDVKAEIEQYIRKQPIKSAFFAPASFMSNYLAMQKPRPSPAGDGTYVLANITRPEDRWSLIDIKDTGAWISAILLEPEKYEGKFFAAAEGLYSMQEIVETMSRVSGKTVKYVQVEDEVFKGYLPPAFSEMLYEMYVLIRDYGYYGKDTEKEVKWAREQTKGALTNLEEFLKKNEFKLD